MNKTNFTQIFFFKKKCKDYLVANIHKMIIYLYTYL